MTMRPEDLDPAISPTAQAGRDGAAREDTAAPISPADDPGGVMLDVVPASDPYFTAQYHLANNAAGQRDLHLFDGRTAVWDDVTGMGVRVAVLDDGVDYLHPDLFANYDFSLQVRGVDGYHPDRDGAHGTAVAGIIAAQRDGAGAVGVAHDARLVSMPGIPASDLSGDGLAGMPTISLAGAFGNFANYDVINNSWGYITPFYDTPFNPNQRAYHDTLVDVIDAGRGGLGGIIVKSAGNGRGALDNTAGSWTTAFEGTIAVAAVERDGRVTHYSTEGAGLLVSAFGGPVPGDVVTTDRTGGLGYDRSYYGDDVTSQFNGTSAAAPMVTGVVALMLEANPDLGYRDVQAILAATARHTGGDSFDDGGLTGAERYQWDINGADTWNGGGMHFSEDYGFGLVDALAAVRLAESWRRTGGYDDRLVIADVASNEGSVTIDDLSTTSMTFTIAGHIEVERVEIDLGLAHTWMSDLEIQLVSPDGTVSELMRDNFGAAGVTDYGAQDLTLTSNAFRGELSAGTWTLVFTDDYFGDPGSAANAALTIIGRDAASDVYVYTEEFSDFADGGRRVLADTDGGVDEINAAAVFSDSVVHLEPGRAGTIDGVAFEVAAGSVIEHAVTGDGDDRLTGTAGANRLGGGRGDDTLDGAAGHDTLDGGAGDDLYRIDSAGDRIVERAGGGIDTVETTVSLALPDHVERVLLQGAAAWARGTADRNTILGSGRDNRLFGEGGDDYIAGGAGNDSLDGGGGADRMLGGAGDDRYVVGNAGDIVREEAGAGFDTVSTYVDFTLGAHVERLELLNAARSGTGNDAANTLVGNALANPLSGEAGDDYMLGGGGGDTLNGGAGNDTMIGGAGDDVYIVGLRNDVVVEAASSGYDTVVTYAQTFVLGDNVERMEFRGGARAGYGNELRNTMIGNDGANDIRGEGGADRLFGGGGRDTLVGGAGDDTLTGGAGSDHLVLGEGADTVVIGAGDSGYGFARRDMVRDFVPGEDRIDLTALDADAGLDGDQAFAFVGTGSVAAAGTVGFAVYGGSTIVSVNTDDDRAIEVQLQLNGVTTLGADDFIL
ncbi:S8 family serine peptidase [Acuticoccus sp. I52.16.1]|uniref:S8 family serine peptidase n=1 Tax=Acuticoccus sp. I52.16.1 TaxID=2928472 RepID=UPI001FD1B4E1|nr:S8 family serine peptidase [Acuticoccus sp. I52.16.1]UOM35203.1 S8 family serine peptidase [Acuticoccus sp. I52.16.1]